MPPRIPLAETYHALADARIGPFWGDRAFALIAAAWGSAVLAMRLRHHVGRSRA